MLLQVMSGGAGEPRVGTAMLNQAERRWLGSFRAGGEMKSSVQAALSPMGESSSEAM
jgi:hypothetical protein